MKILGFWVLVLYISGTAASYADEPSLAAIWKVVQAQQAEIDALTQQLEDTRAQLQATRQTVQTTGEQLNVTADYVEKLESSRPAHWASRTSIGGYGEMHYSRIEAEDASRDSKDIDFHRFVTFFGHEFTDRIRLFAEFELEHSLVADSGDGSNGGEVEIEQAFIEYDLNDHHQIRTGLLLIPVGIINETHEPPTFYGVERNDVENIIIPATWWEGGASIGGHYANGLSWDVAIHSGLEIPIAGGNAYRIRSGRQKVAEASAENLAYTGRVQYSGIPGLALAASVNYQTDASQSGGDGLDEGLLVSVQGIYKLGRLTVKGLWGQWRFEGNGIKLAGLDQQTGWYIEPSLRLGRPAHDWGIYTRFEDVEGARIQDQFDQWEFGVNYWPTERVVLKADYRDRSHDLVDARGRDFNAIDLGVGYQF